MKNITQIALKLRTVDFESYIQNNCPIKTNSVEIEGDSSVIKYLSEDPKSCNLVTHLIDNLVAFNMQWHAYFDAGVKVNAGGIFNRVDMKGQWKTTKLDDITTLNLVNIDDVMANLINPKFNAQEYLTSLHDSKVSTWQEQLAILNGSKTEDSTNILPFQEQKLFVPDNETGGELKGSYIHDNGVGFSFDGYGDYYDGHKGTPVYFECYNDMLRVVVYADINEQEPTHVIDMDNALLTNRVDQQS
tara:strand:+ start:14745 stop:15479 length:735 start_codon:yes stop_codon:yes gene_type:complete